MQKYSCYEYEVKPTEIIISGAGEHEEYKTGYVYTILDGHIDDDYESEEWYDTEAEAEMAAENMIDTFESGPEE